MGEEIKHHRALSSLEIDDDSGQCNTILNVIGSATIKCVATVGDLAFSSTGDSINFQGREL